MLNKYIPEDLLCVKDSEPLEEYDKGFVNNIAWIAYKCPICGDIYSDEPDVDLMPGGVDNY
jgi:hypothetical protein